MHIIERNLYGVDIDEFAVNIAMLRLWLSLAIDFEGDEPEPLPNLEFKVIFGDSLTGPNPTGPGQIEMFQQQADKIATEIAELKHRFIEVWGGEKETTRKEILNREARISELQSLSNLPTDAIDWRTRFAEVFVATAGFDIAIANPPYRRQEGLSTRKELLETLYPDVYRSTADYHTYFLRRSAQLLNVDGQIAFITSNKYMKADYGDKLRAFASKSLTIERFIDFGDLPVFKAAAYPAILIAKNRAGSNGNFLAADLNGPIRTRLKEASLPVTDRTVAQELMHLPALVSNNTFEAPVPVLLREDGWRIVRPELVNLYDRMMDGGTAIIERTSGRIYRGIITGLNEAFILTEGDRSGLLDADPSSTGLIHPWLRGRDVAAWSTEPSGLHVIAIPSSDSDGSHPWSEYEVEEAALKVFSDAYPAIYDHLRPYENRLRKRQDQGRWWWELRACAYYEEFAGPKVIWPDISREMTFSIDTSGSYSANTTYFSPALPTWAVPLMNSTVFDFLITMSTNTIRGGYKRLFSGVIGQLPLPNVDQKLRVKLVAIREELANNPDSPRRDEINRLSMEAYQLSEEEMTMIANRAGRSKAK